jgi:hypothetical protein
MEKLKRLIIQLSNISNTEPLDKWNYFKTKRDINRIFFPLETPILKLEGFCGLKNPSNTCYLNASLQLLFRISTLIDFLHNFESPEEINLLDYNLSYKLYKTELEKIETLKRKQKELHKNMKKKIKANKDTNINSLYDIYFKILKELDSIQNSIDIFDNRCKMEDKIYAQFILNNFVIIYNNYKITPEDKNISLQTLSYKENTIFQNLIDMALNKKEEMIFDHKIRIKDRDTDDPYYIRNNYRIPNHSGEFIVGILRYLSCFDNELFNNFLKSITFRLHSIVLYEDNKYSQPFIVNERTIEIKLTELEKDDYTFQQIIDNYQKEELTFKELVDNNKPISKEDSINIYKLNILLEQTKDVTTRKAINTQIEKINFKYRIRAKSKKLRIEIPHELDYLIVSIERIDTLVRTNDPDTIAKWNSPEWKDIQVDRNFKQKLHEHKITTNYFIINGIKFIQKAVTIHSGTATGGHYVCAICNDDGIPIKLINDETVLPASSDSTYIPTIPTKGITYLFKRVR